MEQQWTKELRQDLNKVHTTEQGKKKLISNLKESHITNNYNSKQQATKGIFPKTYKGLWVAACLCIVSGTAYATGILPPVSDIFAPFFGNSVAQTEIIEQIGRPLNASDTTKGITITAEAIIGDNSTLTIVFKITNKDGTAIKLPDKADQNFLLPAWRNVDLPINGMTSGKFGSFVGDDGHYRLIETRSLEKDMPLGETAIASFEDLEYRDESGTNQIFKKGEWELHFELAYENTSTHIPVDETFLHEGIEMTVRNIEISPISLSLSYQFKDNATTQEDSDSQQSSMLQAMGVEVALKKKDGTVVDLHPDCGIISENGMIIADRTVAFGEIVPLEEIYSVIVGEVEVILNQ